MIEDVKGLDGVIDLIDTIFSGNHDIIMDASCIHTISNHLRDNTYDLSDIDPFLIVKGILYVEGMTWLLPKFKNRLVTFKELKNEYKGRLHPNFEHVRNILQKYILGKNVQTNFPEIKEYLLKYTRKIKRLDALLNRSKCSKDPNIDKLKDLLVDLNENIFYWNEPSRNKVDSKIVACSLLHAINGRKIRAYTLDDGIIKLTKGFINLLCSDPVLNSRDMSAVSKSFLKQVKKVDMSVWSYCHADRVFVPAYDNLQKRNIEYVVWKNEPSEEIKLTHKQKKDVNKKISDYIFKMFKT